MGDINIHKPSPSKSNMFVAAPFAVLQFFEVLQIDVFQKTCALVGRDFGEDEAGARNTNEATTAVASRRRSTAPSFKVTMDVSTVRLAMLRRCAVLILIRFDVVIGIPPGTGHLH